MPSLDRRRELAAKLAALEQGGGSRRARGFWRSLHELSETPEFQELMRQEFPEQADVWPDSLSRRKFLTLMSASLALAGFNGCSLRPAPPEELVPYVRAPQTGTPGKPLFYATAMTHGGAAIGLLVETHAGRPVKIEGNPDHPASLGATDVFSQASILTLYDPDRSQAVTHLGQTRTWEQAIAALKQAVARQRKLGGAGVRLLTGSVVSPTMVRQLDELFEKWPEAKWHVHEPADRSAEHRATGAAFGEPLDAVYDFSKAEIVVSLDADFLNSGPGALRYARDFMDRRRAPASAAEAGRAEMNRLYAVESTVSCTGAKADHRLALLPREIEPLAQGLATALGVLPKGDAESETGRDIVPADWLSAVIQDLKKHRGRSLLIAGERQPASVHLLVHAMNAALGNLGETVHYIEPITGRSKRKQESLAEFVRAARQGEVELAIVLDTNPALTAPVDLDFAANFEKIPLRIHHGLYLDETARSCHWHLPEAHYLEAWSDALAFDGTAAIVQPVIEPLYEGRSVHEVLSILADGDSAPARELVRGTWKEHWHATTARDEVADFETFWQTALHDGIVPDTRSPARDVTLAEKWRHGLSGNAAGEPSGLEIIFSTDPTIYDGRYANNGWLQELPKPLTKLTWGNAAIMSPVTAARSGFEMGEYAHGGEHGGFHQPLVELQLGGRTAYAPLWIMPGHVDGAVSLSLGYGRRNAGRIGGDGEEILGCNAYLLRTSDALWFADGLKIAKTDRTQLVACTQQHHSMEDRDAVRAGLLSAYREQPESIAAPSERLIEEERQESHEPLTLYQPFDDEPAKHKWGMSIDLTSCIGCSACVVACQAENNIPVVGREQVAAGREMHWLRVDRYVHGAADAPDGFYFQPVPCMHCENAPCEYVCPVAATVHSSDGLNDMIYNRCVGTRFCSNNCPYKVRRFNFLAFADFETPTLQMLYNPDVTVRSRGVMEKCTYCVQRIRQAQIGAELEDRPIADGEVITACQAACPTRAISFGDINDPQAEITRRKESPLNYALLEDLNTRPRTTYMAALRNPNPILEEDVP